MGADRAGPAHRMSQKILALRTVPAPDIEILDAEDLAALRLGIEPPPAVMIDCPPPYRGRCEFLGEGWSRIEIDSTAQEYERRWIYLHELAHILLWKSGRPLDAPGHDRWFAAMEGAMLIRANGDIYDLRGYDCADDLRGIGHAVAMAQKFAASSRSCLDIAGELARAAATYREPQPPVARRSHDAKIQQLSERIEWWRLVAMGGGVVGAVGWIGLLIARAMVG